MTESSPPDLACLRGPVDPSLLRDERLDEIFAATVSRRPDAAAITCDDVTLSYAALAERAERIAGHLAARGIGPGAHVGLWLSRGLDLHAALLGILRSGAAYIPFDADAPADRVAECLADCAAGAIVVDADTAARLGGLTTIPALDAAALLATPAPVPAPTPRAAGGGRDDTAYLIYTSGSTGRPKAVVIPHRAICHYLRAANSVYGLTDGDVVFQGASVAFDLSLEEIFIPYLVGARLWVAPARALAETDRLPDLLGEAGITVLDTVPTLLSLLSRDVPSLRVIILGGETCPPALAAKWCRPGRRLFNSYGPTEATVVATIAEITPDQPVTIGRPIPNYACWVVAEDLTPVAPGQTGELLIGGPGIAAGYLGRPELTAEKFVANPWRPDGAEPRLYRSGDAVSRTITGDLAFHGRIDDQVKIRGFRVELGEIEARLVALPGIERAAVTLRRDDGTDRLIAFVVPGQDAPAPDQAAIRAALRERMPAYMVPAMAVAVADLPRLVSGKIDRRALASLPIPDSAAEPQEAPATPIEGKLLAAAQTVFPGQAIPLGADFFLDLGGHSLLAARFVSEVRRDPALASLTLTEIYAARSLRAMAALLSGRGGGSAMAPPADLSFQPPPLARRFLCGLAQAAVMPLILTLTTLPWLGVFVSYMILSGDDAGLGREIVTLLLTYAVINIGTIFGSIGLKWLAIGRTRPGRYPLWGLYYFRWWLSQRAVAVAHLKWFQGTPIMSLYLRALGARVGRDCNIGEVEAGAFDLISIGRGTVIGGKVKLANAEVIGNELVIGAIDIGDEVHVGTSCAIGLDTHIGGDCELADLSALAAGTRTGRAQLWEGSPARPVGTIDLDALPEPARASRGRKAALSVLYLVMLVVLPPISLIPIFPAFTLFENLSEILAGSGPHDYLYVLPLLAWPTAMALIVITVALIAVVRWTVLPVVTAGTYSVYGGFYVRKWIVALTTELVLETLSSLYATVYMRWWYRLMGAKIGRDSEISCNLSGRYDLTEIGEKCFIADEVVLGDEVVRRGWMILEPVRIAARVFVGNDAVVPPGARLPEGTLIGIKSRPPLTQAVAAGDTWFGSPPLKLPVRQRFDAVESTWTFTPPRWRRILRVVFEAFAVSLPSMLYITFGVLSCEMLTASIAMHDYPTVLILFMLASVGISVGLALCAIAVKWGMMGIYRPTAMPMWSWWALRTEAIAVMYWGMAGKVLFDHLRGTPFLPWALRLYGCRFGRGVFMDTTDVTEFDCIDVGDYCAINAGSALQTHLYEDRVMKVGQVRLGRGVSIGSGSTVLYDTHVGDYARVGLLTIVMKGESIPANGAWEGAPAQPSGEAAR